MPGGHGGGSKDDGVGGGGHGQHEGVGRGHSGCHDQVQWVLTNGQRQVRQNGSGCNLNIKGKNNSNLPKDHHLCLHTCSPKTYVQIIFRSAGYLWFIYSVWSLFYNAMLLWLIHVSSFKDIITNGNLWK